VTLVFPRFVAILQEFAESGPNQGGTVIPGRASVRPGADASEGQLEGFGNALSGQQKIVVPAPGQAPLSGEPESATDWYNYENRKFV
jgi:hypothetical protein